MPSGTLSFAAPAILVRGGLLAVLTFALVQHSQPRLMAQVLPAYIEALAPDTGPAGTKVTITGINFTGATRVIFNEGRPANFQLADDTQILASVPEGAISGPVSVETPAGIARSQSPFKIPIP